MGYQACKSNNLTKDLLGLADEITSKTGIAVKQIGLSHQYFMQISAEALEGPICVAQCTTEKALGECYVINGVKFYEWPMITNSFIFNF